MKSTITITPTKEDSFIHSLNIRWPSGRILRCKGIREDSRDPLETECNYPIRAELHDGRHRFSFVITGGMEVSFLGIEAPQFLPPDDRTHEQWDAVLPAGCS